MAYIILGTIYVEQRRLDNSEDFEREILDVDATANHIFVDAREELEMAFDDIALPEKEGVFVVTMVVKVSSYQDYFGEWDTEYTDEFLSIRELPQDEIDALFDMLEIAPATKAIEIKQEDNVFFINRGT